MSNVEFDGGYKRPQRENSDRNTAIGRLFMKLSGGKIKTQQQANVATIVATILIFAAALYVLFK